VGPGTAGRTAAEGRAAVGSPARASEAADSDTAAEEAAVGSATAGGHNPAAAVRSAAGETCGARQCFPRRGAHLPPAQVEPDAVAAGDAGNRVGLPMGAAQLRVVAPETVGGAPEDRDAMPPG
jgi:hypothetical protein